MPSILDKTLPVSILVLVLAVSFACSDQSFQDKHSSQQMDVIQANDENPEIELEESEPESEKATIEKASEPVMVGGTFLSCSIDYSALEPNNLSENMQALGCSVFLDEELGERQLDPEFNIAAARFASNPEAESAVDFVRQPDHPRWTWITQIPESEEVSNMVLTIESPDGREQKVEVDISDVIPPSMIGLGLVPDSEFKLRMPGTDLCIHGDPMWSGTTGNFTAHTLTLAPCEQALSFQISPWLEGYRVHTEYPSTFTCEEEFYDQELCERVCIDLNSFGNGDDFELFACTFSQEAQMLLFEPGESLSVKFSANNRNMTLINDELKAAEANDPHASFQFISVPPVSISE